ncbi:MAG: hypothetical protein M0Z79_02055 [Nitrospiraceae bacterium]|nr:hypothetical protein [Nitrospiraceae bacterium]
MNRASVFLACVSLCLLTLTGLIFWSGETVKQQNRTVRDLGEISACLRLTDLSFSHDARYTRHPSQADLFSAFQDHPGSIEHFPSGSVSAPPDFSDLGATISTGRR